MVKAIEVENLTKYYGQPGTGVLAVDHISFEVHQGEVFGFLGPNGAGAGLPLSADVHPGPGEPRSAGRWLPEPLAGFGRASGKWHPVPSAICPDAPPGPCARLLTYPGH